MSFTLSLAISSEKSSQKHSFSPHCCQNRSLQRPVSNFASTNFPPPSPDLKPRDPRPEATQTRAAAFVQQEASTSTLSFFLPCSQNRSPQRASGNFKSTTFPPSNLVVPNWRPKKHITPAAASTFSERPAKTHPLESRKHTKKCFDCFDQSALSNPDAGIVQVKSPFVLSRRKKK
ncbi:unnamed protein product [Clonostachys rosea f. rosea IK726]|uniref:Uncharacterized protein n=1 Tax=Clonostachys rosea f. rosea IK726 TaxID=1349383 RepID=A0ACA9THL0_BIOOC|nr:unnamed protein product [Clonostachys rosea f. rosea IK726]